MRKIKLIAFDLDGVLVDGRGSWHEVHEGLGTLELSEKNAKEFYEGKITFEEWAKKDVELWHGVEIKKIERILSKTKLMRGASETLRTLKKRGYKGKIILISAYPNLIGVEDLVKTGIDCFFVKPLELDKLIESIKNLLS